MAADCASLGCWDHGFRMAPPRSYFGMMQPHLFLDDDELRRLTGFSRKSKQIQWLRDQALPFWVSATGHPVVARATVEGHPTAVPPVPGAEPWEPRVLSG